MTESNNVVAINIEQEMKTSFLDYSMSVIVSRALPDVRDGLKPVHRRILYAMHSLKNFHNRPYLKSARIVGDVIGKYHPHGDSAVYDALVRLAQDFSLRYTLIDGQGNFGSIDGDSAAAMRYTESRLGPISEYLLKDLEKGTVDFQPNYDNKDIEPKVMPSRLPQLIVNGASGIAVGMATNIPPHNVNEVISAIKALMSNPDMTVDDLMTHMPGPDFPTSAEIHGISGIRQAYATGRGSIAMRSKAEVETDPKTKRERIVVTEIPYQVNKLRLIEKIADLVRNKKLEGISDIRDESSKLGIRIVVEVKRNEPAEIILNHLYKLTPLQTSMGINMVALCRGVPKLLSLKEILSEFIDHRREVVVRRTAFLLNKAQERAHILLGLKIVVENVDEVVSIVRNAKDTETAHRQLKERFELSDIQAKAILDMRLAKLTGLERDKILNEYNEIMKEINDLTDILEKPERVTSIVIEELDEVLEKFGDERKTKILAADADEISMEALVADEEVVVTLTKTGYVKRTKVSEIQAQKRGGRGRSGMLTKDEDFVQDLFVTSNHQSLLCFTNKGKVYSMKVYRIPEAAMRSKGKHIANVITFEEGEELVSILPIKDFQEEGVGLVSVTKCGYIKKTELKAYSNVRANGIIGLKLDEGDQLVRCILCRDQDHLLIATSQGKLIRFESREVRPTGRASRGVTGIRFGDDADSVVSLEVTNADSEQTLLTLCENGYGKRSKLSEYRVQSRGGIGIYTIKASERNGSVVGIVMVDEKDDIVVMTSQGTMIRMAVKEIGVTGRNTQGVRVMRVSDGEEKVISFNRVVEEEEGEIVQGDSSSGEVAQVSVSDDSQED